MPHTLLAIAVTLASTGLLLAQEETFAERHVYDATTGTWRSIAPPVPGTEDGDLEVARSRLARGQFKEARKAFKTWFKAYPESPRRPEGLFYAADTEVSWDETDPGRGDLMKAYNWYEELLEGWAGTDLADRAVRRELIIAEMFLFKNRKQKVWKGMLRLGATDEALTMLDRIIDQWAPNTPVAQQALRLKADYHYDQGEFEEAETAYARLTRDYPRGRYHRFAMLRSGQSALARFPGVQFDDADLLESEVYFTDFQARYPKHAAEAGIPQMLDRIRDSRAQKEYTIAAYYERTKARAAAIFYYRQVQKNWADTIWATQAHQRLVALGAIEPEPVDYDLEEVPTSQPTDEITTETITQSQPE